MVPTYFRRELRDRVLQRRLRPRTLFFEYNRRTAALDLSPRHTPRKRGIQYAAAVQLDYGCLWNTGSPASAGDDKPGYQGRHQMSAIPSKGDLRKVALDAREAM